MLDKLDCTLRLTVHPAGEPSAHGFGPGTAQLLRGVERYGSLNRAAKEMGMAYSKAWTGIKNLEELFGFSLMERHGSLRQPPGPKRPASCSRSLTAQRWPPAPP